MATAETFHPVIARINPVNACASYGERIIEKMRISYTDRTKAAERVADALHAVGPVEYLEPEILPATEEVPLVRSRFVATVRHNRTGHRHQMLITSPLSTEEQSDELICTLPGITQNPSQGNANLAHRSFADAHPDMKVISIHTDGIGEHDRLKFWQALHHPFIGMAQSRLDILQQLTGGSPVHLNGFSMSTALVVKITNMNESSQQINIGSKTLISPAIVTPDKAKYVMGYEFLPYAYRTELEQAAARRIGAIAVIYKGMKELQLPCIGNALQLGQGTEALAFLQAASGSPLAIIYGSEDPLAQPNLYKQAAAQNPGNVHIIKKYRRGHSVSDPSYATEIAVDIRRFTQSSTTDSRAVEQYAA